MIYMCFNKCVAHAENYDHSHCYASRDPKTENQKYSPIYHTSFGYCASNDLAPNSLRSQVPVVQTNKIWSILDHFIPIFVNLGERAQTALE